MSHCTKPLTAAAVFSSDCEGLKHYERVFALVLLSSVISTGDWSRFGVFCLVSFHFYYEEIPSNPSAWEGIEHVTMERDTSKA